MHSWFRFSFDLVERSIFFLEQKEWNCIPGNGTACVGKMGNKEVTLMECTAELIA